MGPEPSTSTPEAQAVTQLPKTTLIPLAPFSGSPEIEINEISEIRMALIASHMAPKMK